MGRLRALPLTRNCCLVSLMLGLSGCQTAPVGTEAVHLTWEKGLVTVPGGDRACVERYIGDQYTQTRCLSQGVKVATGPVPAVLFLHGCAGINQRQLNVMRLFTLNGYVTFMPDSFARPGRYMACGKRTDTHLRYEEISHALAEMRKIPWIDQKRLILAGFSSGGLAAAEYWGDEFKVRVILGWGCSKGISAASSVPVLNLVGKNDFETWAGNALCSVVGRENSLAQHVNAGHDVSDDPKAMAIVKDFLERQL